MGEVARVKPRLSLSERQDSYVIPRDEDIEGEAESTVTTQANAAANRYFDKEVTRVKNDAIQRCRRATTEATSSGLQMRTIPIRSFLREEKLNQNTEDQSKQLTLDFEEK